MKCIISNDPYNCVYTTHFINSQQLSIRIDWIEVRQAHLKRNQKTETFWTIQTNRMYAAKDESKFNIEKHCHKIPAKAHFFVKDLDHEKKNNWKLISEFEIF